MTQYYAVLRFQDHPVKVPNAPLLYPAEIRGLGASTTLPPGSGWVLMTQEQLDIALSDTSFQYWASITQAKLQPAVAFGQALIAEFVAENIAMGITQSGQTLTVTAYLATVANLLQNGSLYGALTVMQGMAPPSNLAPFVTTDRIHAYINKIQTFLGLPLT